MQIIRGQSEEGAVQALAARITKQLADGRVLWLVCGGSNIPIAVEAMRAVREAVSNAKLQNLTVALTDERYGPVGHADSNWQQLLGAGFDGSGIETMPVLTGKPLEETVQEYMENLERAWEGAYVIAQLGIGTDGHIMGVLPHTAGVTDTSLVCSYEAPPYVRITLTLSALGTVSVAFAFALGAGKREVVERLAQDGSLADMPAQILTQLPEAYLWAD